MVFGIKLNPQFRDKIDQAAVERAYVSGWTFWHLMSAHMFTQGRDFRLPPGMDETYEALTSTDPNGIKSGKELDAQFNAEYDRLNGILRRNLHPEAFRSESYRNNLASFKEPQESADVPQMRKDFRMSEDVKIYVVKREFFNYFLIEEKGSLKVFTLGLRTKDRM